MENVQGDERDAILFSIGYGPDEKGHVSNNFGPINKPGGGKRLNVAFSRARVTMTIFTSIYSTDIKITETSPDGVAAFRDFLQFAEGHDIHTESAEERQAKLARAGIMQNICKAIEKAGFQPVTMVGHSDFHVDIAVVDPTEPSKYMLGILLDGDGYRQTKNTRDREIAQIGVLKNLGWNICRVWTIDWWDNREKELNKILNKLTQLKAVAEKRVEEKQAEEEAQKAEIAAREAEAQRVKAELVEQAAEVIAEDEEAEKEIRTVEAPVIESREEVKEKTEKKPVEITVPEDKPEVDDKPIWELKEYETADVPVTPISSAEFSAAGNKNSIAERIIVIVNAEAPILKENLMRKVFASYGVTKSKATEEAFEKALKASKVKSTKAKGAVFCWNGAQDPKTYSGIRISTDRSGEEICQQEIRNAICYVLNQKGALPKDELLKETSLLFGYKRLGKNLEAALAAGLQWAKSSGAVISAGNKIFDLPK